jgi:deoxyribonuclease-4
MKMILGCNIYSNNSIIDCVNDGYYNNANIIQIYFRPPSQFYVTKIKDNILEDINKQLLKKQIKIVIHGSFIINFCRPLNDKITRNAIKLLVADMINSVKVNALGVIIHMGKNVKDLKISNDIALQNYINNIKIILKLTPSRSTLILETGAGQGNEIATSIYELSKIRESLSYEEQKRVKYCLDTCHMYSGGYNFSSKFLMKHFETYIDIMLGWKNIVVIHLNDSKTKFNSRVDRHADIGKGMIRQSSLMKAVEIFIKKGIPMVLETPEDTSPHKNQIENIHKYVENNKNLCNIKNIT